MVLKWHKALQDVGILILYEIVGKFYISVMGQRSDVREKHCLAVFPQVEHAVKLE